MAYGPRLMYAYFDKDIVPEECSSVAARIKYRITVLYFQAIITSLNTFDGLAKDSSCRLSSPYEILCLQAQSDTPSHRARQTGVARDGRHTDPDRVTRKPTNLS